MKLIKFLILLLILCFVYLEFFATQIEFINKTPYKIYMVKGEYNSNNIEPTTKELDNDISRIIDSYKKQFYSVSTRSQLADYPVGIYIGWNTRIYDSNGDAVSVLQNQGSSFRFSKDGFCDYEITIYQDYVETKGMNKNFCYRKILASPN